MAKNPVILIPCEHLYCEDCMTNSKFDYCNACPSKTRKVNIFYIFRY